MAFVLKTGQKTVVSWSEFAELEPSKPLPIKMGSYLNGAYAPTPDSVAADYLNGLIRDRPPAESALSKENSEQTEAQEQCA